MLRKQKSLERTAIILLPGDHNKISVIIPKFGFLAKNFSVDKIKKPEICHSYNFKH